jgi:hypothetical protein
VNDLSGGEKILAGLRVQDGVAMAIERSVMSRVSKKWFEAERTARPAAKHLVMLTKRPTLLADQALVTKLFKKTKCRSGLVALVEEKDLEKFRCVSQFCQAYEV